MVLLLVRFTPILQLINREALQAFFTEIASEPWAPILFMSLVCVGLSIGFPLTPFTLVGGVVFGVWPGSAYNWGGTLAGACSAFLITRYLARGLVERLLKERAPRLNRLDQAVARNGFQAVFAMRLIPIIPFNLSNFAAGLTGVSFAHFLAATALALIPLVLIGTYFAHTLWHSATNPVAQRDLILVTLLMILMSTLPWLYRRRVVRNAESRTR